MDTSNLESVNLIHNVAKILGAKVKYVLQPNKQVIKEPKYKNIVKRPPPDESVLVRRSPVVTVMGHVDHGKTTLLDALRSTSVVETEFGGITQHIGAFNVMLKSGEKITFLDTPGHAAFSSMRFRGAHITDIVLLVVAADDGVKDQTLQSIEMANDANVPIVVAINKIDKPNADIKRTQNMLAQNGIVVEELGGNVQCINISALNRINLQDLTEAIVLQAELLGLQGDPVGLVEGVAIECACHIGRGKLVTALIQRGTLRKGCLIVSGLASAKVRAMFNEFGRPVLEAKPSEAVQIIGWKKLPKVGDEILEVENERELQMVLRFRENEQNKILSEEHQAAANKKNEKYLEEYKAVLALKQEYGKIYRPLTTLNLNLLESQTDTNNNNNTVPVLNVIIKGDVAGSVEAILDMFDTYKEDNICRLNVVHYSVGHVTKSDLEFAEIFNAIIYHFNVGVLNNLKEEAKKKGISLRQHNVIYKLFDNIKEEINNRLPKVDFKEVLGEAKVQEMFQVTDEKKKVNVAGCCCLQGVLQKSAIYDVIRREEIIYTGKVVSMRHLKNEVSTIKINVECGIRFEDPTIVFKPGDTLICYKLVKMPQTITWDPGY
ncbi:mitochondrial translation initiation factor 2 isoform X2 [Ptiloglossa arizonensis]